MECKRPYAREMRRFGCAFRLRRPTSPVRRTECKPATSAVHIRHPFPVSAHVRRRLEKLRHLAAVRLTCTYALRCYDDQRGNRKKCYSDFVWREKSFCVAQSVRRAAKLSLLNFLSLFRDLQKPTRFSGGGVVAGFFRDLQEPTRFSGGGGSSRIFP